MKRFVTLGCISALILAVLVGSGWLLDVLEWLDYLTERNSYGERRGSGPANGGSAPCVPAGLDAGAEGRFDHTGSDAGLHTHTVRGGRPDALADRGATVPDLFAGRDSGGDRESKLPYVTPTEFLRQRLWSLKEDTAENDYQASRIRRQTAEIERQVARGAAARAALDYRPAPEGKLLPWPRFPGGPFALVYDTDDAA